jgi:hypothetical protein
MASQEKTKINHGEHRDHRESLNLANTPRLVEYWLYL